MTQSRSTVRAQRAQVVGELVREHRRDEAGHVRREARARRRRGRAASRRGTKYETSAMCTQARIPSPSRRDRDRVVEVLRGLGVDREREEVAQVGAPVERSAPGARTARTAAAAPSLDEQPLEDGLDPVGRARARARAARARGPVRTTARSPGPTSPSPFRSSDERRPGREVRLADDELAAPGDLDDDAVASDLQEAAERQAGAGRAEQQADAEQDQRGRAERERLHVGVASMWPRIAGSAISLPSTSRITASDRRRRARRAAPRA